MSFYIPLKLLVLILFFLTTFNSQLIAQSKEIRALLNEAELNYDTKNYATAIEFYNQVLESDNYNITAYKKRGQSFLMIEEYDKALLDYRQAIAFDPSDKKTHIRISEVYALRGDYNEALAEVKKIPEREITIEYKYYLLYFRIITGEFEIVLNEINEMKRHSRYSENPILLYIGGLARELTGDSDGAFSHFYSAAEKKIRPIEVYENNYRDHLPLFPAMNFLLKCADNLFSRNYYKEALEYYEQCLSIDPKHEDVLRKAGICSYELGDLVKAEQLFKRFEWNNKNNPEVYFRLCEIQRRNGSLTDALVNCLDAIRLDSGKCEYFYNTGFIYEEMSDHQKAREHYYEAIALSQADTTCAQLTELEYRFAKVNRIFWEENKESEAPVISVTSHKLMSGNVIFVSTRQKEIKLQYKISDQSTISHVTINGQSQEVDTTSYNPELTYLVKPDESLLEIEATDVYGNSGKINLILERQVPARIIVDSPPNSGFQIIPESYNDKIIKIKGRIETQLDIQSIRVNGIEAEFNRYEMQPEFEATVDLSSGIDSVIIEARDRLNYTETITYFINREKARQVQQNPVGRTWVYFISNWNYEDHSKLTGPEKDLTKIKEALSDYQIDSIVVKRNLEKRDFEKFFVEDLPNDVKRFKINSLLIWYAGHGKKFDEYSVYWIPVKAARGKQIDYYDLVNMKSELGKLDVTHLLVVSDACQTGSAFSRKMRDEPAEKKCERDEYDSRSRLVLTSSNSENSDDNSKFAEYFCQILKTNSRTCLPVERIYSDLKVGLKKHGQHPVFEPIDMTSLNKGTFFFFRRED